MGVNPPSIVKETEIKPTAAVKPRPFGVWAGESNK